MGLSFLPAGCRAGAGAGTETTGVVATGVDAGVGVAVGRVADVAAKELSEDGTATSLLITTGTPVGADNSTAGTGEEKGVEVIDNAGVETGTRARAASGIGVEAGNPKDGAIAKGFADPVTDAGIPPILGEAEDCDNRKKGAAATKLLPALLDGTEEPKPVFDPKIEGFCASDDGFEKPNDEETGTDKGAGVKEDPMGCVKVLD